MKRPSRITSGPRSIRDRAPMQAADEGLDSIILVSV
jgi:hypothetical protein